MKNILLLVHDDPGQEARLQAALDLTRALDGHLTCVDVTVPPVVAGPNDMAVGQAILLDIARQQEAGNRAKVEGRLAGEGVPRNWVDTTGVIADAVLDAAVLADLIVLNRKLESYGNPDMHDIASRIVMRARRPILAVPETTRRMGVERALIAWDGEASCAATLRACVPLLALADKVEIFMVRDGADGAEPAEAAEYLSRHGIHPTICVVDDAVTRADELIAEECVRWQADYVMMGAYGRGRLMESFGGVTKRLLAKSEVPLVLGH